MRIRWSTDATPPGIGRIVPLLPPALRSKEYAGAFEPLLIQNDYEYPVVAVVFGWDLSLVQYLIRAKKKNGQCPHRCTDGTIDCPDCGVTSLDFIYAAAQYLRDHDGVVAEDPGYYD